MIVNVVRLKKYKEPIKRSIKLLTMQKLSMGAARSQCPVCNLVFDMAALLEIHSLVHAQQVTEGKLTFLHFLVTTFHIFCLIS